MSTRPSIQIPVYTYHYKQEYKVMNIRVLVLSRGYEYGSYIPLEYRYTGSGFMSVYGLGYEYGKLGLECVYEYVYGHGFLKHWKIYIVRNE